ncbi:recombinase family protein [Streptomyces sp. NPDC056470]|uniref:recombinase family protein n=1 Tax=Streptomyces sp. NPDC056470 TaxID=3345831 RepID=UPI0036A19AF3
MPAPGVRRLSRVKAATTSPERQREDVLAAAASVGGHIIDRADDWEVSGATDPMTRPRLGHWLRDEKGRYDGLVASAVDRLGRNVVDCLNTATGNCPPREPLNPGVHSAAERHVFEIQAALLARRHRRPLPDHRARAAEA